MNLFNFIKSNIQILDVINEYVTLKKTGALYWKSPCPFHQEKTPSFTVSPDKDIFYCFGCNESGDVISFIAKIEKLSQFEAAQYLVEKYNLSIPETVKTSFVQSEATKNERDAYVDLCKKVAGWCNDQLYKHEKALHYLHSRKFNQESITQFTLGYFPKNGITFLLKEMSKVGFLTNDLVDAGILFKGRNNIYSPFENRMIFPIKDHLGRFCGFGGRVLDKDDDRPKYYNSRENSFFQKGTILFGLDVAKKNIQSKNAAFLVEGYTDCIAMHSYGFKNSIATLGTACTIDHLKKVARYTQRLYIMYDSDKAGEQAILRLAQLCWSVDIEALVICLPKDSDPASFLMKKEDLKPYIMQAQDIFSFFLKTKGKDFQSKSLKEKLEATSSIIALICSLKDPLKQDILLLKASEILQISLETLRKEYSQNTNKPAEKPVKQTVNEVLTPLESKLFSAILHHPTLLNDENETLLLAGLPSPYNELLSKVVNIRKENPDHSISMLQEKLTAEEQLLIHQQLFVLEEENMDLAFEQMLLQFQKKHWKSIVVNIKMKLRQATQDSNNTEVQKIVTAFQKIKLKLLKSGRL